MVFCVRCVCCHISLKMLSTSKNHFDWPNLPNLVLQTTNWLVLTFSLRLHSSIDIPYCDGAVNVINRWNNCVANSNWNMYGKLISFILRYNESISGTKGAVYVPFETSHGTDSWPRDRIQNYSNIHECALITDWPYLTQTICT